MPRSRNERRRPGRGRRRPDPDPEEASGSDSTVIEYTTGSDSGSEPEPEHSSERRRRSCLPRRCGPRLYECARDLLIIGFLVWAATDIYARKHEVLWFSPPSLSFPEAPPHPPWPARPPRHSLVPTRVHYNQPV